MWAWKPPRRGREGRPTGVCATQPGVGCGVCVCAARGAGKGRARRATLHRQAVDHRMRSTAWVSVCVRWPMLVVVRAPWSQKRCASWRKFVGGGGRVLPCGRDTPRAWQGVVWAVFFWGGHRARWGGVGADRFVAHLGARGHAFTGGVGAASGAKSRGSLLVSEVRGLPQTLLWLVLVCLAGARMQRLFQN